jgi:probable rRNA maturation factor
MLDVANLTKKPAPGLPWTKIKEKILGKSYELSLVLAGNKLMKKLNKTYRKKDKTPETLSFAFSKKEGEIFLNMDHSKKELLFFYIHSLLHLKGLKHGEGMKKKEDLYYNYFYGT